MIYRVEHGREIGFCVSGQRRFCAQHGLDFRRLVREGLPVEELAGIEDSNLARALAVTERESRHG